MKKLLIIFLFFIVPFNLNANDKQKQLDKLFLELKNDISNLSNEIEEKIWKFWSEHPTNQRLTLKLQEGSKLVRNQQLNEAIIIFTEIIEQDPSWAEAWNKRATVFYMIGEYQASQDDIDKVLKLEKRHFGALAGQGLVNIKLKNYEKAIKSYEMAREIYPSMKSPNIMIKKIQDLIKDQSI